MKVPGSVLCSLPADAGIYTAQHIARSSLFSPLPLGEGFRICFRIMDLYERGIGDYEE